MTVESARVGVLGFGGPAGQIALMHRLFVEDRAWISDREFSHGLGFVTLLPGPEAQQLATWIGWRLLGVRGALVAGVLFVLPGALIMLALSAVLAVWGQAPALQAVMGGIAAAVVALIAHAGLRLARKALLDWPERVIALLAFAAIALVGLPFPLVMLAAAVSGLFMARDVAATAPAPLATTPWLGVAVSVTAWVLPPGLALAVLGPDHILAEIGLVFSAVAMTTFGGAYAALAWLAQEAAGARNWLSSAEMAAGLALAESTPGPAVLVNQFVGFLAGWREGGAWMALACAAMASWCTFAPSFVWVLALGPQAGRMRAHRWLAGAMRGVTAAALGAMAAAGWWLAAHTWGSDQTDGPLPWLATFDPAAFGTSALAAWLLVSRHWPVWRVLAVGAVAGAAMGALR